MLGLDVGIVSCRVELRRDEKGNAEGRGCVNSQS